MNVSNAGLFGLSIVGGVFLSFEVGDHYLPIVGPVMANVSAESSVFGNSW